MSAREQIKVGKWYFAAHGFDLVVGRCIGFIGDHTAVLSFRRGGPFRSPNSVCVVCVGSETPDPRVIPSIWRGIKGLFK